MRTLILGSAAIMALGGLSPMVQAEMPSYISLGIGYYNLFDEDKAIDLRTEYRSGKSIVFENLHPYAGLEVTFDGSTWAGGGVIYNYSFAPGWYVTPGLGVGLYHEGDSERDLDFPVQFRTQFEVSREFEIRHRAGIGISHISNASFGDGNPGAEVLSLYWHIPFDDVF